MPMAFGTWGGMGPECSKLISKISKRAAGWHEGEVRASLSEQGRLAVGWALMTKVLDNLTAKNYVVPPATTSD